MPCPERALARFMRNLDDAVDAAYCAALIANDVELQVSLRNIADWTRPQVDAAEARAREAEAARDQRVLDPSAHPRPSMPDFLRARGE